VAENVLRHVWCRRDPSGWALELSGALANGQIVVTYVPTLGFVPTALRHELMLGIETLETMAVALSVDGRES
jgi:hypothetical protein